MMAPTSPDAPTKRRPGGRSARVRATVLEATLDALAEGGEAVGIPQIAVRAGVHETSIYRRWGSLPALVVDAVGTRIGEEIPLPDTGSLRGDLLAFLESGRAFLTSHLGTQLVRATVIDPRASTDETRHAYWSGRLGQMAVLFERAVARGEIARPADIELLTEMVVAPLYFRLLITHVPLDDLPERVTEIVLRAVGAGTSGAE
jgi:AcrR family transcriptional regulator